SLWSNTWRAVVAVNEHFRSMESKVDPSEDEEEVTPTKNPKCGDKEEDEGKVIDCKACTAQLKNNAFGVQLTCYECQQGKGNKTCPYIIKDNPKFIVSAKFFEIEALDISETSKVAEISGNLNTTTTKDKKLEKEPKKAAEKGIDHSDN
ncbi:hypothetical protein L9F63_010660, partial [Diploptera punctata]